jgi:hypothetical protein
MMSDMRQALEMPAPAGQLLKVREQYVGTPTR